ncbi:MAG: ABC transporter ATP-binding protein [Deltaproteobacteria bacterium]|nr:ABC transporter ATP-binding protein [Deltaproteobacteria bacterium]
MNPILEILDVSKVYQEGAAKVVAVDSVSLSIKKGEALLIMGPSGSGKTTLLSMMGCILHPTKGDVVVDGRMVGNLTEDALPDIRKKYFGFVFQSFNLFPSLTSAENVEAVLRLKGWDKKELKTESVNLLKKVGLGERADFYPRDLSGGEKQRVAFARALAGEPPIILADEPTANLDSRTGKDVLGVLRNLAVESGKAVVIVSHDPNALDVAHTVVHLEDGKIISQEKPT